MNGESSQAPRRAGKRQVIVSDDESDGSPVMNGSAKKKRRAASSPVLEDDDLDELTDGETPRRKKGKGRAVNGNRNGDHHDDDGEEDGDEAMMGEDGDVEEGEGEAVRRAIGYRPEYDRDDDGYVTGSVTRIKTRNFMTYDFVEFRPGPHLNMILGPNGTGKSSIAAAIAIGLGFPPKIMGRASELHQYVRQGTEDAETEIELKGSRGKRNHVIWRHFYREGDRSEWKINGQPAIKKAVTELVTRLGIQANNLCSFLPQDKVAEFAHMDAVVVLKETMRAAGDPRLTQWHEALVTKGNKGKELESALEKNISARDVLKTKADRLEPAVATFQAQKENQFEREVLEIIVLACEHRDVRDAHSEMTAERKEVKAKLRVAQARSKPLMDLHEKQKEKLEKAKFRAKMADERNQDVHKTGRKTLKKLDDIEDDGDKVTRELDSLKGTLERRQREKKIFEDRMKAAEAIMETPLVSVREQYNSLAQQKRELRSSLQNAEDEGSAINAEISDGERYFTRVTSEINDLSKRQRDLTSVEVQRENAARDLDPSIGYALDWLEQHGHELEATGHELEATVHKPPMISVNVRDRNHAWQVEMCTNMAQRKTFICQNQRDYTRMLSLNKTPIPGGRRSNGSAYGASTCSLNLAIVEVTEASANPRRPCSPEELAELGFVGWAIDFVDADPVVISYLNNNCAMYQAAVTLRPSSTINTDAVVAKHISQWITSTDSNRSIKSAYGRRDHMTTTQAPQPARAFDLAVDQDAVKRLVDQIAHHKREKIDREAPHQESRSKQDRIRVKYQKVKDQMDKLEEATQELQRKQAKVAAAKLEYESNKRKLEALAKEPSVDDLRRRLREKKKTFADKMMSPLRDYQEACEATLAVADSAVFAALATVQFTINCSAIQEQLSHGDAEAEALESEMKALTAKIAEYLAIGSQILDRIREAQRSVHRDVTAETNRRMAATLADTESVQADLQRVMQDLELGAEVDGRAVQRYEQLKKELGAIQITVDKDESELAKIKRQLNRILSEFDPAIDTLVEVVSRKFSAAFERLGCSGEVKLDRVEGDFAAWGIRILVSYRDSDALERLTGTRQSGGERSLATVTYLMSLSEMARTPFSLVDEINQGMDQKAERNVHNQLVDVTCSSDAGQYFLLTPKLLVGLHYHPKMRVLVINNGTWIPDSTDPKKAFGGFNTALKRYAKHHGIAAA